MPPSILKARSCPNSKVILDKGMLCYLTLWTKEFILFLVVHLDFDVILISQRILLIYY